MRRSEQKRKTALDNPGQAVVTGVVQRAFGIAVTDAGGHPIAYQAMLKELADPHAQR